MVQEKVCGTSKHLGQTKQAVLVIHGGAGTMTKAVSSPEQRRAYRIALARALKAGHQVLAEGGEAMDAAVAAVATMEDDPLFNVGKGAVFTTEGKNELEASIMLSKPPDMQSAVPVSRRGVSVALLTRCRNPSKLARALYLHPELVPRALVCGSTAESLGERLGVELVDPCYFFTEHRWREHRRGLGLPDEPFPDPHCRSELIDLSDVGASTSSAGSFSELSGGVPLDIYPTGTVGAVALDVRGCIASVTSTGGKTNKLPGRIGDTPLMGAGFWAEEWDTEEMKEGNPVSCFQGILEAVGYQGDEGPAPNPRRAVGVSGTGDGDYFIRRSTASTVARRVQLVGDSVDEATRRVVQDLWRDGGIGGVIALDEQGKVALPLNCPGMYRGVIRSDGIIFQRSPYFVTKSWRKSWKEYQDLECIDIWVINSLLVNGIF